MTDKQKDQQLVKKHCQILGISVSKKSDHSEVKKAFSLKIRSRCLERQSRVKLNLAYDHLCTIINNITYTPQQKQLIEAIYKGNTDLLKQKMKDNPQLFNFRKQVSLFPLIYLATRSGHYDVVELMLKSGCLLESNSVKSQDRSTAMHCAAYYGFGDLIPLLAQYGFPIKIKNFCDNLPVQETSSSIIKSLLSKGQQSQIYQLIDKLRINGQAITVLNLTMNPKKSMPDVKKIILRNYFDDFTNYEDAFHGTDFDALFSIAKYSLRRPGERVNGRLIEPTPGHIPLGVPFRGFANWSNAVFLSPSIFYAVNSIYSQLKSFNHSTRWHSLVQVKYLSNFNKLSKHQHSLGNYVHKDNQPTNVQYRVEVDTPNVEVKVVAILLVREGFLEEYGDKYSDVTSLLLNSENERQFRKKNQQKFGNTHYKNS